MLERVWPAGLAKAKDREDQTTGVGHPRGMYVTAMNMKRQCRKAERMWRKTKLEIHYSIYKDSLHAFNLELATARQTFFSNLINSNLNNTRTLFATVERLTNPQVRFPVKCSLTANAMSLLPTFQRRSVISGRRLAHLPVIQRSHRFDSNLKKK